MKIGVKPHWAAWLARIYIAALYATLRVRHLGAVSVSRLDQMKRHYILAFWHAHLLLMVYARYEKPMTVMISQHRDGEVIARAMELFGIDLARGSTTRGGSAALRAMLREAQKGNNLAFTPDGPRGPRRIVQPGVVAAARITGLPVIPVVISSERKRVLKSWDRMEIPRFFSRVIFAYGEPIDAGRSADLETCRLRLEREMNELAEDTDRRFGELWRAAAP